MNSIISAATNDEAPTAGTDRGSKEQQTHLHPRIAETRLPYKCPGCFRLTIDIGGALGDASGPTLWLAFCRPCAGRRQASPRFRRRLAAALEHKSRVCESVLSLATQVAAATATDAGVMQSALARTIRMAHPSESIDALMLRADAATDLPPGRIRACLASIAR